MNDKIQICQLIKNGDTSRCASSPLPLAPYAQQASSTAQVSCLSLISIKLKAWQVSHVIAHRSNNGTDVQKLLERESSARQQTAPILGKDISKLAGRQAKTNC